MSISEIRKIFRGKITKEPGKAEKGPEKKSAPPPLKPALFEEKKQWHRKELGRKMSQASPYIPGTGSAMYFRQERKQMIDKTFSGKRFGTHISGIEAKTRLRELRKEEYRAKTSKEKRELGRLRAYLDRETGLKGKY